MPEQSSIFLRVNICQEIHQAFPLTQDHYYKADQNHLLSVIHGGPPLLRHLQVEFIFGFASVYRSGFVVLGCFGPHNLHFHQFRLKDLVSLIVVELVQLLL